MLGCAVLRERRNGRRPAWRGPPPWLLQS